MRSRQIGVRVVPVIANLRARVELDESNAALNQTARQQALLSEVFGDRFINAVQLSRRLGLFRQVHGIRSLALHPVGQFVAGDPRLQRRVLAFVRQMIAIHLLDEVQRLALRFLGDAGRRMQIQHRIRRAAEHRSLIHRRQKPRAIRRRPALGGAVRHHHKRRQILILRPQAVSHPGAKARPSRELRT